ncbi:MAG: hypothetical protein U0930_13405 [Pirellulales bacterium]
MLEESILSQGGGQIKAKRIALVSLVTVICVLTVAGLGLFYLRMFVARPASQVESAIVKIPLGISAEEADALMGSDPDATYEHEGILANSVTMVVVTQENISKYGQPQLYTFRSWKGDVLEAIIVLDHDNKVVGRWAVRRR